MSIESPRISVPEPTVEVIPERKRSRRRERFDRIPSGVEGIDLIAEPGTDPHFNKRRVKRHQADSDRIARYRNRHLKIFQAAKDRLVDATNEQEGFRGVVSSRGNYEAPLVPSETKIVYDAELLESSTGEYHQALVREEGKLVVELPFGSDENAQERLTEFAHAVAELMIARGRDPKEVGALITPVIIQRLDEQRLNQLISSGKIELLPGTRKSETSWNTPINPIDKMTTPRRQRDLIPEAETS